MEYHAKIEDSIVIQVLRIEKEQLDLGHWGNPNDFIQTYNDASLRKNFAGIGYTYDASKDAFISPKPYPSWILNEDTCRWEPPTAMPDDDKRYNWNEDTTSWDLNE